LPPLPSPLLCPRRSFVSALVLASKFMQDKCYSNRAWPKVVPWSAREVGLGERALGEALEWRLWVGKASPIPQPVTSPAPPLPVSRPISRCRSESNLQTPKALPASLPGDSTMTSAGLRRCSTLPAYAYDSVPESSFNPVTHTFEEPLQLPLEPPPVDVSLSFSLFCTTFLNHDVGAHNGRGLYISTDRSHR
jgi:PHO85 cyclin-5